MAPRWYVSGLSKKSYSPAMQPPHACEGMMVALNEPDTPVDYYDRLREYGIYILDGTADRLIFQFCPWCGTELPRSLRDEWFEIIRSLGLETKDKLPRDLRGGMWWRERTREPAPSGRCQAAEDS